MMRTLWFIRHGESMSNAGLPVLYPAASQLTLRGMQQAVQVAAHIPMRPDLIVASSYIRTQLTAQPLIERFPDVPQEIWPIQEFTELSLPPDHLSTNVERSVLIEAYWERGDPWHIAGPRAESFADLMGRAEGAITAWRNRDEAFTVVFSHATFMRALLWSLITPSQPLSADRMRRFRAFITATYVPNTGMIKFVDDGTDLWNSGILAHHVAES